MPKTKKRKCIDCHPANKRNAPHPGPRCATHHKKARSERKGAQHEKHIEETYNITAEEYWQLYHAQEGMCAICQRATGKIRRLSVDHDHQCCNGSHSCGYCVRGLLCRTCNSKVLGHLRDDIDALERAIEYLREPPSTRLWEGKMTI